MGVVRDIFIGLSENKILNDASKQVGLRFGAQKVVGGTGVKDTLNCLRDLNNQGMSVTFDNLGNSFPTAKKLRKKRIILLK